MTTDQKRIVDEARSWIGTPFYPHGRTKGVGVDCVQLAREVYTACGMVDPTEFESYKMADGETLAASKVLRWLYGHVAEFVPTDGPLPGRLVTLKVGRVTHHVGIVTGGRTFVQAVMKYGVREFDLTDSTWGGRVTSYWRALRCSEAPST